jgi:hypothetical protein
MNCGFQNQDEYILNRLKNGSPIEPVPNQKTETTVERLKAFMARVTKDADRYSIAGKTVKKRLSEVINKLTPATGNAKTKAETSKFLKEMVYLILEGKDYNALNDSSSYKLKPEDLSELVKGTVSLKKSIQEKSPDAQLFVAQPFVDSAKDIGTTIDLIVLYKDNTADLYAIHPFSDKLSKKALALHEQRQLVHKDMLLNQLGILQIKQSRDILIRYKNKVKPLAFRKEGDSLSPSLALLKMNPEYIPIAYEETGNSGIDQWLKSQYNIIEQLSKKVKTAPSEARPLLYERIDKLKKQVDNFLNKQEINLINSYIFKDLSVNVDRLMNSATTSDLGEINDYILELSAYENIRIKFDDYIESLTGEAKELVDKSLSEVNTKVSILKAKLEKKRIEIAEDTLDKSKLYDEYGNRISQINETWAKKVFGRLSSFSNQVFQKFYSIVQDTFDKTRIELDEDADGMFAAHHEVMNWLKSRGEGRDDLIKYLWNPKTGNLVPRISGTAIAIIEAAKISGNPVKIQDIFEIKNEAKWKEVFTKNRLKKQADLEIEFYNADDPASTQREVEKGLKEFDRMFDLSQPAAWTNTINHSWLKLKESFVEANYSNEYNFILANAPLKNYYDSYTKLMSKYIGYIEMHGELNSNFLPNIRKDLAERLFEEKNFGGTLKEMFRDFSMREDDYGLAVYDEENHKIKEVPIYYTNSLTPTEKSLDFTKSLLQFGKMAIYHQNIKKQEAYIHALKATLADMQFEEKGGKGNTIIDFMKEKVKSTFNQDPGVLSMDKVFEVFQDAYLYGINVQDKDKELMKGVSSVKLMKKLMAISSRNTLGLNVIAGIGGGIASRASAFVNSRKNLYTTSDSETKATKAMYKDRSKALAFNRLVDPLNDDLIERWAIAGTGDRKSLHKGLRKYVNDRMLYSPFRITDSLNDQRNNISVAYNYGVDANGNLKPLKYLPKGTESLFDQFEFKEDGTVVLKNKTERESLEILKKFRRISQEAQYGFKAAFADENKALYQHFLIGQVLMQFKNFLPGMLSERFKQTQASVTTGVVDTGRYRAWYNSLGIDKEQAGKEVFKSVAKSIFPGVLDIVTFGKMYSNKKVKFTVNDIEGEQEYNIRKIDLERLAISYNRFRLEQPTLAADMNFQQFIDAHEGQMAALATELRMILIFLAGVMLLGMEDDDEEPLYKKTWATKKLYQTIQKAQSELMYFYNPVEILKLQRSPIAMARPIEQAFKSIFNGIDETRDLFEENSPQDKSDIGYHSRYFFPGFYKVSQLVEMYEQDEVVNK